MRLIGLCDHQQAGRIAIDAVDDTGALDAANAGQLSLAMVEQGIDERAVWMPRRRMDHQASRFVDDDQMLIFENDIQRNILRLGLIRSRGRDVEQEGKALIFPAGRVPRRFAVDQQSIFIKQRLNARPR